MHIRHSKQQMSKQFLNRLFKPLFCLHSQGELTITADMEALSSSLFLDVVPDNWAKRAYPSLYTLGLWYADLLQRVKELETWTSDFQLPAAVWLGGFFNPQSFLTAIMQQMARKNEWPLDRMVLQCDVTKKTREDMAGPPREGAYVHGLFMEGGFQGGRQDKTRQDKFFISEGSE